MSGFTDTILIDCNRTNSAEKHTGGTNTSQFTCRVSDGLKLNVGDIVSVHSGFISERGCGDGDVIEVTGRDLDLDYEVEETELQKFQLYLDPYNNSGTDVVISPEGSLPPNGALSYRYIQKSVSKRLTDNKVSMSITYYKTNNGQGYAMLPRRFDFKKKPYDYNSTGTTFGWYAGAFGGTGDGPYDSYEQGRTMMNDYGGFCSLDGDMKYQKNGMVPSGTGARRLDSHQYNTDKLFKYRQDNSRFTLMVCEQNFVAMASQFGVASGDTRYISDTAQGDAEDIDNTTSSRDTYSLNANCRHYRDPCLQEWIIYKETKDIEIETGFQSPEAIAKQMTDQLQKRGDVETIYAMTGGTTIPPGPSNTTLLAQSPVSCFSDSECYKAFPSANAVEFSPDRWTSYWTDKPIAYPPTTNDELNVIQYVQQYSTIGVKRPDLWIAGRELLKNASQINAGEYDLHPNGNIWEPVGDTAKIPGARSWRNWIPGQMLNTVAYDERNSVTHADNKIVTSYEWNETNLNYFKELFRQQGRDETLFKTGNSALAELGFGDFVGALGSDKARFIHINLDEGPGNTYPFSQLGCDNYEQTPGAMTNAGWQAVASGGAHYIKPNFFTSMPLFITFEPERENIARGGLEGKEYDMYYGFAIRETVTMPDPATGLARDYQVISFNTSRIGGIYDKIWSKIGEDWVAPAPKTAQYYLSGDLNGNSRLDGYTTPRKLGYDPHFNAYGTASMVLYTGMLDGPAPNRYFVDSDALGDQSSTTKPVVHSIKQRYVGANEPTINWDPDESKFQIQALHTPEYTGNEVNAGENTGSNPINADAGTPVWYINKHLLKRDFCPDMMPYLADVQFSGGAKVSATNINIEPWNIFDALCGIFIESFNINEDKWQDSLMGIMGFEYSQFNSDNTLNQRQRRLNDEITFTPQGSLTTNAVIKSSDVIQFKTNVYGAELYTGQLPAIESEIIGGKTPVAIHGFYSNVSDRQTSASIEAQRLPRKMLTPYYIIRSDIISDAQYNSDGKVLPIVYVVNKENGFGDFFFQNTTETNFTVTKARTITEITTSIHNPDMSIAPTNEGSGIIYKIIKNNNADMNVAQEILNKNKKK